MDASQMAIKELAQSTRVQGKVFPLVTFFGLSPKAKQMISVLSKLANSTLLRQLWKESSEKALKMTEKREGHRTFLLSVDEVEELVWAPSNERLQSLQERFLSGVISFEEIDKLFLVFNDSQDLAKEMRLLISKNDSQVKAREDKINKRMEQIEQYYELRNCIDAARNILEFKERLGLQGNFQLVEDVCNQVCQYDRLKLTRFTPHWVTLGARAIITFFTWRCLNISIEECDCMRTEFRGCCYFTYV